MSHTLRFSSIMKSNPSSSNPNSREYFAICSLAALNTCTAEFWVRVVYLELRYDVFGELLLLLDEEGLLVEVGVQI